jgi:hypothetical protein
MFNFYILGIAYKTKITRYFIVIVNIMLNLGLKLLLGTNFLYKYKVKLNFIRPRVVF